MASNSGALAASPIDCRLYALNTNERCAEMRAHASKKTSSVPRKSHGQTLLTSASLSSRLSFMWPGFSSSGLIRVDVLLHLRLVDVRLVEHHEARALVRGDLLAVDGVGGELHGVITHLVGELRNGDIDEAAPDLLVDARHGVEHDHLHHALLARVLHALRRACARERVGAEHAREIGIARENLSHMRRGAIGVVLVVLRF